MIELLAFILLGCILGVFTGLTPGIHVNTISMLALAFGAVGSVEVIALIVAMGVTHSFVDFIPSILFGAPDSDSFLGVLPGHRLLLKGEGLKAIQLTVAGGLIGGIGAVFFSLSFMGFVSAISAWIALAIPWLLILVIALMVLSEQEGKRAIALLIVFASAVVGMAVLKFGSTQNAIMAPVTGFFAISTLLWSIRKENKLIKQKIESWGIPINAVAVGSVLSVAGAGMVSMIPGIGPSQAAFVIRKLAGRLSTEAFLSLIGGINTANLVFSLFVWLAIGKTRTGVAVAIDQLVVSSSELFWLFSGTVLIGIFFSVVAVGLLARFLVKRIHLIPYKKMNFSVLGMLVLIVWFLTGAYGLVVLVVSSLIGYSAIGFKVKRSHCMAFLIVPTVLLYLGI